MPTQSAIDAATTAVDSARMHVQSGVQGAETASAELALATARSAIQAIPPDPVPTLPPTEIVSSASAWCWFQGARALLHEGKIFIGYVANNQPAVGVYDLDGRSGGPTLLFNLGEHDDHNNPGLAVVAGQVMAAASRHNRDTYLQTSVFDGTQWSAAETVANSRGGRTTYPSPLDEDAPRIRLRRWRTSGTMWITARVTTDGTDSNDRQGIFGSDHFPYTHAQRIGGETWWWACPKAGNHVELNSELGLWKYRHADQTWRQADGTVMPPDPALNNPHPTTNAPRLRHELVTWFPQTLINPNGLVVWNCDPCNVAGTPGLAYQLVNPSTLTSEYWLAQFDGTPRAAKITDGGRTISTRSPHYTGNLTVGEKNDGSLIAICGLEQSGVIELQQFVSSDNGQTWLYVGNITSGSTSDQIRPFLVRGSDRVVWMHSGTTGGYDFESFAAARMMMAGVL